MFVILNWWCDKSIEDANIITDESGRNIVFETEEEAEEYAKENLNGYWVIAGEK